MAPAEFFASAVSTLFKDKLPSRNTDMAIANLLRSRSLLFREQTTLNELCPHCHEKKLCMWALKEHHLERVVRGRKCISDFTSFGKAKGRRRLCGGEEGSSNCLALCRVCVLMAE